MPIRPPQYLPEEDRSMIVLYALKQLQPCDPLDLHIFITQMDVMTYFDMMDALNNLCDRGQAARLTKHIGLQYVVTEAGEEVLTLFGNRVPGSAKRFIDENYEAYRTRFREQAQYKHKKEQLPNGDTELTFSVVDSDSDLMRISWTLPTDELANSLINRWYERSSEIYKTVVQMFMEDRK